jgi:hypothetical protein
MRATSDLSKFNSKAQYRIIRLRRLFDQAVNSGPINSPAVAYCVIELDNLVVSGLREFTVSSLCGARTATGAKIHVGRQFGHEEEIGAYIMSVVSSVAYAYRNSPQRLSRKDEPTIRDPRDTHKVLRACGATNEISLSNALSLNTSLFSDLATVRNFYAHRGFDTWRKVKTKAQAAGLFAISHADSYVTSILPMRPVSVFEDWLDDAALFFDEMTK